MNEVRNILIGFEINADASQICYYDRAAKEPVQVAAKVGTNLYAFPTVLAKARGRDEWHVGYEAEYFAGSGGVLRLPEPLGALEKAEAVMVDGAKMEPYELLARFIRESLRILGLPDAVRCIGGICVTTRALTPALAVGIRRALLSLGIARDACFVQDENESFYYYGYSQGPEVASRNLALLKFAVNEVTFRSMTEMRRAKPATVTVDEKESLTLSADPEARDEAFAEFVKSWNENSNYSGIFITGSGFSSKWAKKSVKALSRGGARVFAGDNLFVRGACLTCVERLERRAFRNRIYLGPELAMATVGIDVRDGGNVVFYPLVRAGISWYENAAECQIILDDRRDLMVTVVSMDGEHHRNEKLPLAGLPERPEGATRLLIAAECVDKETCRVTARDLGFGELYLGSGMVWTKDVRL